MYDQFQALARTQHRFAKDGSNVQHAEAAHFEKIAQQGRTTPFDHFRRDAVELDHIVGDQAATAADQFQRQFALADTAVTGEHHTHAQYIEKHAVHGG